MEQHEDGSRTMDRFFWVNFVLEPEQMKALESQSVTRCNYSQWLGAEVVRIAYQDPAGALTVTSLTREEVVRRVANSLDGSHPSAAATERDGTSINDAAIRKLLSYHMGGIPLPYFVLLKIAQDILEVAPKLLGVQPAGGAK